MLDLGEPDNPPDEGMRLEALRSLSVLHSAHAGLSPERALGQLTRIQHHRIHIAQGDPVAGVSAINAEQAGTFSALGVKKPAASQQLPLL